MDLASLTTSRKLAHHTGSRSVARLNDFMPPTHRPTVNEPSRPATAARWPKLEDVASVAGVSKITASRPLGNPSVVLEATRLKVHEAVANTGYLPYLLLTGRALVTGAQPRHRPRFDPRSDRYRAWCDPRR